MDSHQRKIQQIFIEISPIAHSSPNHCQIIAELFLCSAIAIWFREKNSERRSLGKDGKNLLRRDRATAGSDVYSGLCLRV
ncbi:MAG: hypothetical protein HC925_06505 [Coleofasciculaceae cyanobacterium SM2_3_26]|nr:hypothetical protein [Coleofasciculaceae cyanobacterium SM2_3_26]